LYKTVNFVFFVISTPVLESKAVKNAEIGRFICLKLSTSIIFSFLSTEKDFHQTFEPITIFTRYSPGTK
jgi:hypothetical protein